MVVYSAAGVFNILEDSCLGQQSIQFSALNASLLYFTVCATLQDTDLEFFSVWLCHVHRFAEYLGSEHSGLLKAQVLTIVILECADSVDTVLSSSVSFPSSIVARRVRAEELEALDGIVACIHQRDAKGSAATIECVDMLLVGKVADELLNIDGNALAVEVALGMEAAHVDQHVCIRDDTRDGDKHMLVHLVELATLTSGHKQG